MGPDCRLEVQEEERADQGQFDERYTQADPAAETGIGAAGESQKAPRQGNKHNHRKQGKG